MTWHPSKISEKRRNVKPEEEEKNSEPVTQDPDKPSSRFDGTNASRKTYEKDTPGQGEDDYDQDDDSDAEPRRSNKVSNIKKIVKKRNK